MKESWRSKAESLAVSLAQPCNGGKMLRIERAALEHSISPATAHHLLRSLGFVERLRSDDPRTAELVTALPYQALIALERWYARDQEQMLAYLKDNPSPSVRQLTAAEKFSRGLPSVGTPAEHAIDVIRSLPGPLSPGTALSRMVDWAGIDRCGLEMLNLKREVVEYNRALGVDYFALTPGGYRAALLVGPTSETAGHYGRHAKSIWYNAVSATTLCQLVIVLLPSKAAQLACLTSMPVPPNNDHGWPDWNSPNTFRGRPKSGPVRPASPAGGVILFTSPERVCDDWQT